MKSLRGTVPTGVAAQFALIEVAAAGGTFLHRAWWTTGAMALLGVAAFAGWIREKPGERIEWALSIAAWAGLFLEDKSNPWLPAIPGAVAVGMALAGRRWERITAGWALATGGSAIAAGYLMNSGAEFYGGLGLVAAALVYWRIRFALQPACIQMIYTVLLLTVGIPALDWFLQPQARVSGGPENWRAFYSYDKAHGDARAFATWYGFFEEQREAVSKKLFEPVYNSIVAHKPRAGGRGVFLQCPISINNEGFRGPEISRDKRDAYRIVALGESTTFGMTIGPQDKPWPELLEQMIRERLRPKRRVEVINAGIMGYSLSQNLPRLMPQILPLKPDLLISYHGYNDFTELDKSLPPRNGPDPPEYPLRPLRVAAECEYRFKMRQFIRENRRSPALPSKAPMNPLRTPYAESYEMLIQWARTNGVKLALANYSMAINSSSDERVMAFYRGAFPEVDREWRANAQHSMIVAEMGRRHGEVCLINTHYELDGAHEKFIDHIHLTQEGREQLAENIFAGIRAVLEKDLGAGPAGKAGAR